MRKKSAVPAMVLMAIAIAMASGVSQAEAQSAADYVGKWTIAFEPPAGAPGGGGGGGGGAGRGMRAPMVLDVTLNGGALAATVTGGMGGGPGGAAPQPRAVSDVKIVDGALVLTYSMTMMQGEATPVTLKLTRAGSVTNAAMDVAGRFQRTGTATKE